MSTGRPKATTPLVLVVEDHDDTRRLYATHLEAAGYRVETAENGDEAIVLARRSMPDAIVMDLAMPRVDGWEATQTLKSAPKTRNIWIIAVTGMLERRFVDRAQAAGVDSLVHKPVEPHELVRRVASGIAHTRREQRA